jgi:hypothetical protein
MVVPSRPIGNSIMQLVDIRNRKQMFPEWTAEYAAIKTGTRVKIVPNTSANGVIFALRMTQLGHTEGTLLQYEDGKAVVEVDQYRTLRLHPSQIRPCN